MDVLIRIKVLSLIEENHSLKRSLNSISLEVTALRRRLNQENEQQSVTNSINKEKLSTFLNADQMTKLESSVREWSNESIVKGLKFRFSLGVHGYEFLRSTGYPLPGYSTLTRRIREFKINFGTFQAEEEILRHKVSSLAENDRFCILSFDEMEISEQLDYDKNLKQYFGHVTLGDSNILGNHLLLVLARGVKSHWKQAIGCHITSRSTNGTIMKTFILACIDFVEGVGLQVVALSSDMGSNNRGLWRELGIQVKKTGIRTNSFLHNNHPIWIMPDVVHLMKNLKQALLTSEIIVPESYKEFKELSSNIVRGSYLKQIWESEIGTPAPTTKRKLDAIEKEQICVFPDELTEEEIRKIIAEQEEEEGIIFDEDEPEDFTNEVADKGIVNNSLRMLHHLQHDDIFPSNYGKMDAGPAVRFISVKTAAAIEFFVNDKKLPPAALTTADFLRLFAEWFSLLASKEKKRSITKRNRERKFLFLNKIINIIEETTINNYWKPLNTGIILATLSSCDIAEYILADHLDFILGHRFTQDCVENVFSQIRRRGGAKPSALTCVKMLKLICIGQYLSDIKTSNYFNDNDVFLIDYFKPNKPTEICPVNNADKQTSKLPIDVNNLTETSLISLQDCQNHFSKHDLNLIFNLGGSTTRKILSLCCENCKTFLCNKEHDLCEMSIYKQFLNLGGLKEPCTPLLLVLINCELMYRKFITFIFHNNIAKFIDLVADKINIEFPKCCNIKFKIIKHYFTVRGYTIVSYTKNMKKRIMYGTASKKK